MDLRREQIKTRPDNETTSSRHAPDAILEQSVVSVEITV